MASALQSFVQLLTSRLQSPRYRILAPLVAVALLRIVYHRRRRHLEQLQLHRRLNRILADGHTLDAELDHRAREEWHEVDDGVEFASIVYPAKSSAERPKSNVMVLFIPGNPGIPHYYLPLMREIVRRHGAHHEVRAMSHSGHYMPWKNNYRVFDLEHQVEHKLEYLRERIKENPQLKLVLISHSIGSYLALQIVEAFPHTSPRSC
ncbi:hypothetical protein PINS_up023148 [Pythium insidiosum]|nr:hypothetical protein PINS_up023148 [Pythium insidiosum]